MKLKSVMFLTIILNVIQVHRIKTQVYFCAMSRSRPEALYLAEFLILKVLKKFLIFNAPIKYVLLG